MATPRKDLVQDSSRTVLELIATVMEASFKQLGEGVVMGTLPRYLEAFGQKNARFVAKRYVEADQSHGAVAALTPINFVSRVTGTPFTMVESTRAHAVKRLHGCEFLAAFESKAPFSKAMVCMLHKAVYQGSVNGLIPPTDQAARGFDVDLRSRILFGDAHCDFGVTARAPLPATPDQEGHARALPSAEDMAQQSHAFYTAILAAFVDYLTSVLPQANVEALVNECATKVGAKVEALLERRSPEATADPKAMATALLAWSGRTVEATPRTLKVTACPYARPIEAATREHDEATALRVRENACRLCHKLLEGAVGAKFPGTTVSRSSCITLGDADCRFRVGGA